MASSGTSTFKSEPGFCPDCGTVLPLLGLDGGVKCYTCHRQFGPEVFGKMEQNYTIHFNSVESFDTQKKNGEEEAEGPVVERRCPKLKPEFTPSVDDDVDAAPRWQNDAELDGSNGEKWGMFCDPSGMEDDSPPQSSPACDDSPAEGKNMWSPLESKRFISGIEGRFEYAEDRFKYLAQQLYQSRDQFLHTRGTCEKEVTDEIPLIQSGISLPHASAKHTERSEKRKKRPSKQADTDSQVSSQDIHNTSTGVSSESLLKFCVADLPTTGMHVQRDLTGDQWIAGDTDSSDSILHAGCTKTTIDVCCQILSEPDTKPSSCDLHSDIANDQGAKGQPAPMPTPKDIKQTRKFERVTNSNHNSSAVVTSGLHNHDFTLVEEETNEDTTLPIRTSKPNGKKYERKRYQAKNTDKGAFTAITSRSHADWSSTDEENNGNIDRSCQNKKSKHKELSKATTGKIPQLPPNSRTSPQSTVTKKGNVVSDTNIENISRDIAGHGQFELSVNSQSKYNNENSNDLISKMSHTRRASSLNCEMDNVKIISKTSLSSTSKKKRISYRRDKTDTNIENISRDVAGHDQFELSVNSQSKYNNENSNDLISKMSHTRRASSLNCEMDNVKIISKTSLSSTSKKKRISYTSDEINVGKKESKSTFSTGTTSKVARMTGRNDEIDVTIKRSKSSFGKIAKVAKATGQNGGTVVTNKKSKSRSSFGNISQVVGITSQNNGIDVPKKRSKVMFDTNTSKLARISYPNNETGVTVKRSKSDFADIRKVERMTVQNYSRDIPLKRSKSIVTSKSQKKLKYLSPYAQSSINKGAYTSLVKQKPSDPRSQMITHSSSTIAVYVKPKPPKSICPQLNKANKRSSDNIYKNKLRNSKVLCQYPQLCPSKKGSKSTIYSKLHVKHTPSNPPSQLSRANKVSMCSITSRHETKRKHRKSQHRLKKLKTRSKCIIGDQQSKIEQETLVVNSHLKCLRNKKTRDSQNELMENYISDETIDTLVGVTTEPDKLEPAVIHDNNMYERQYDSLSKNVNQSNTYHYVGRNDTQQDNSTNIESEQRLVKSTPLVKNCSRYASSFNINKSRGLEYKNTMFVFSGLQKHYLVPTISSQMKRVMKSPFTNRTRRIMPFVAAKSTMPSHNINIQIQDVISMIRTHPFKGDISTTMSNLLRQSQNSTLNLQSTASVPYKLQQNTKSGTQSSMSHGWKHRPQRLADISTPQRNNADITVNGKNDTCCCYPSQTKSNYQEVLNKYIKHSLNNATSPVDRNHHEENNADNISMCMSTEEFATAVETDGMRGRRLLSEILGYIHQDFQRITQNLKENSFHQNASEEEMGSIRATVERNTAIVDETMKLMDEGKELQNKYRRLAHAVTQDVMFDSHTSMMPNLREPPLSSRLRSLMLNIKHFKEELTLR